MAGVVEQIAISPVESELPAVVGSVEVLPGQGPRGDRYFQAERLPREEGRDLTLIEAEALEAMEAETGVPLTHEESRRNVLTRGISLNDLVGKRFRVGEVECVGIELCEPCSHLQGLTRPGVLKGLVHRGGLRCDVLAGGTIAPGDAIHEIATAA